MSGKKTNPKYMDEVHEAMKKSISDLGMNMTNEDFKKGMKRSSGGNEEGFSITWKRRKSLLEE